MENVLACVCHCGLFMGYLEDGFELLVMFYGLSEEQEEANVEQTGSLSYTGS